MDHDRGDIVVGWLTKLVLVLGLLGLVGFDAAGVGVATVSTQDVANNAAREASETYLSSRDTRSVDAAYDAADVYVTANGGTLVPESFRVEADGTVFLTVHKSATTLLLYRIGGLKKFGEIKRSAGVKSLPD